MTSTATLLDHGPLQPYGSHVLWCWGALPGSMPLKRTLVAAKKANGRLVIHNAIGLREAEMAQLLAWGEPEDLIVPNGFHRLDAPAWKARVPQLKVWCPRGARERVAQVVPVDATLDAWVDDGRVAFEHVAGTKEREAVMTVRGDDGPSLVFTDVVFNMPHQQGFKGWVLRHVTASSGGPKVSRLGKLALVADQRALAAHLLRLADTPGLQRVFVAHHEPILEAPAAALRQVADSLR